MITDRHLEEEAVQRSRAYGMLSRAFLFEPDPELIRYFKSNNVQEILRSLDLDLGPFFLNTREEDLIQELSVEFTRLFLAPPYHLPPIESFYVGGLDQAEETFEPSLQGRASTEVQAFYRDHGILLPDTSRSFPDHISTEMEALHLLCELESRAAAAGQPERVLQLRRLTGRFLEDHLNRWIPLFCSQVLQKTENPFYRILVQLTQAFIASELETLRPCCLEKKESVL